MRHSDDLKILATALAEFQKDAPEVIKDSMNPHFKNTYASLGAIVHEAGPKLAEHGLSVVQLPGGDADHPTLITMLMHVSGAYIEAEAPLILDKANSQGLGSAITYMRRYAYCAALGIVADEDDDGEAASKTERKVNRNPAESKVASMAARGVGEDDPNKITIPQVNMIRRRLNKLGMSEGSDLIDQFKQANPDDPWPELGLHDLTKVQASNLIDQLGE